MDFPELLDVNPIWGLYPEEIVNTDSKEISTNTISIAIVKVLELVKDRCELILPGHGDMSYEEILDWIKLESMFSSNPEHCDDDLITRITLMIPVLLSKYTDLTLGHLVQSVRMIRHIWANEHYNTYGSLIDFSRIISDVFNEAGLEPKGKPMIP